MFPRSTSSLFCGLRSGRAAGEGALFTNDVMCLNSAYLQGMREWGEVTVCVWEKEKQRKTKRGIRPQRAQSTRCYQKTVSKSSGGPIHRVPSMGVWLQRQFWFHDVMLEFHLVQSNNISQQTKRPFQKPHYLVQSSQNSQRVVLGQASEVTRSSIEDGANSLNTHTHTFGCKTRWPLAFFSEHNAVLMSVTLNPIGDRQR